MRKLGSLDAVLLLEKSILSEEYKKIESVINDYAPFDTMSRALGLACRCRDIEIVRLLVKNKARFDIDAGIAAKYGFTCKHSHRTVQAKFQLLPVVHNIWDKYLFGSFDKHYRKRPAKTVYSEILKSDVDLSGVPSEMEMGPVEDRIENILFLVHSHVLNQADINILLYYSILEKEYELAEKLDEIGAVIDVPWLVADADHTQSISELNQYLDTMCRMSDEDRMKTLDMLNIHLQKNKKRMYVTLKSYKLYSKPFVP